MKSVQHLTILTFLLGVMAWTSVSAGEAVQRTSEPLTVAVLEFETEDRAVVDLGQKISDLLTVFMSAEEGMEMVERAQVEAALKEMELGASGIVASDQATRIGGMVGAQVLVTGRAFLVNEKLYIAGKAISVETSRVNAQLVRGSLDEDLDVFAQELASKLAGWLRENADRMVAHIQTPADQVQKIRKALGKKQRPLVSALVYEQHIGQATVDPAAETELVYLMKKVGVPVISTQKLHVSDWAEAYMRDADLPMPSELKKADIVVVGEGFSEFAGRRGNLISVKARVEMRAIDTKTGRVVGITRGTETHVDLSEQVAGKTALQKAAGKAAVELVPQMVDEWLALRSDEAAAQKAND